MSYIIVIRDAVSLFSAEYERREALKMAHVHGHLTVVEEVESFLVIGGFLALIIAGILLSVKYAAFFTF